MLTKDEAVVSLCVVIVFLLQKQNLPRQHIWDAVYPYLGHLLWCQRFIHGLWLRTSYTRAWSTSWCRLSFSHYMTAIMSWWEVRCFYNIWKGLVLLTSPSNQHHIYLLMYAFYNSPFTTTLKAVIPQNYPSLFTLKWACAVSARPSARACTPIRGDRALFI